MNLYRKIRPDKWDDVVGNKANVDQLKSFISDENRPHCFLFTGDSGCGKTTLARILATELGVNELSLVEKNMADDRGIDGMREIIEKMRYKPVDGGNVVYMLDEFHMATKEAQSAMLKPFEDTPGHVYFMLCTTDPQKVLKTIKTRSTIIDVEPVEFKSLFRYLLKVSKEEGFNVPNTILKKIAENSDSIRGAIVQLEQVCGISDEEEQLKLVSSISEEDPDVRELCQALLKCNWKNCVSVLKTLRTNKMDSEKIRYAVLGYMTSVVLNGGNDIASFCLDIFGENTYDSKFAGIVSYCYEVIHSE